MSKAKNISNREQSEKIELLLLNGVADSNEINSDPIPKKGYLVSHGYRLLCRP